MTPRPDLWSFPADAVVSHLPDSGLINDTFLVCSGEITLAILQRLNTRIFVPEVHEDIDAVTTRLTERGVPTTRIVPLRDGPLWHTDPDGGVWRALTPIGAHTRHALTDHPTAHSAGALVARWHAALRDLRWDFRSVRAGAHDTPHHMALLETAIETHRSHRLYDRVAPLADEMITRWARWGDIPTLPERIIHGDLKISNLRFDGNHAVALIDLDTCARGTLDIELGDAMRSWCNPAGEDDPDPSFHIDIFAAAMAGYAEGARSAPPGRDEWESVVPATERICLELASRFARDALEESYFGWSARYGTRGDHNLIRATSQLGLARSVHEQRDAASQAVARAISP